MYFENIEIDGEVLLTVPVEFGNNEQELINLSNELYSDVTFLGETITTYIQMPNGFLAQVAPPEAEIRLPVPEEKWAVIKMLTTSRPIYRPINISKICGNVSVGSKLNSDPRQHSANAEVLEICTSRAKAEDFIKLIMYRETGNRKRPHANAEDLKPKIWTFVPRPPKQLYLMQAEENYGNPYEKALSNEIRDTFGNIEDFFNKPPPEFLSKEKIDELNTKAKNVPEFVKSIARIIFSADEQQISLDYRDPIKVKWLRQLIAREFRTDSKLANEQLWLDAVKSINQAANGAKRRTLAKKKKTMAPEDFEFA